MMQLKLLCLYFVMLKPEWVNDNSSAFTDDLFFVSFSSRLSLTLNLASSSSRLLLLASSKCHFLLTLNALFFILHSTLLLLFAFRYSIRFWFFFCFIHFAVLIITSDGCLCSSFVLLEIINLSLPLQGVFAVFHLYFLLFYLFHFDADYLFSVFCMLLSIIKKMFVHPCVPCIQSQAFSLWALLFNKHSPLWWIFRVQFYNSLYSWLCARNIFINSLPLMAKATENCSSSSKVWIRFSSLHIFARFFHQVASTNSQRMRKEGGRNKYFPDVKANIIFRIESSLVFPSYRNVMSCALFDRKLFRKHIFPPSSTIDAIFFHSPSRCRREKIEKKLFLSSQKLEWKTFSSLRVPSDLLLSSNRNSK